MKHKSIFGGEKHHVLLINPAVSNFSQNELLTHIIVKTLPMGIGYIAGYLLENNVPTRVIDEQINLLDYETLEKEIAKMGEPSIIGITCFTLHIKRIREISEWIRRIKPSATIVLGGIHPTVMPDEVLYNIKNVNIVVRGEGEITFHEVVQTIIGGNDLKKVKGISFKDGTGIIHNPPRNLSKDINIFPPFPYHLFKDRLMKYSSFGSIISSRGCPYNCIYCSQKSMTGTSVRFLSVDRVIKKIECLVEEFHQNTIIFQDDMILANPLRLSKIIDAIKERGIHRKAGFVAQVRGDFLTPPILLKLKEANFVSLYIGMETGSQRILDLMDKKSKVEDSVNAVKMASNMGISTSAGIIYGMPTETAEDRMLTFKIVKDMPLESVRFNIAIPYPGTRFYEIAKEEGRLNLLEDYINFGVQYYLTGDKIPYHPAGISPYELIFETMVANLKLNLRWRILKSMIYSPIFGGNTLKLGKNWIIKISQYPFYIKLTWFIVQRFFILWYLSKVKR